MVTKERWFQVHWKMGTEELSQVLDDLSYRIREALRIVNSLEEIVTYQQNQQKEGWVAVDMSKRRKPLQTDFDIEDGINVQEDEMLEFCMNNFCNEKQRTFVNGLSDFKKKYGHLTEKQKSSLAATFAQCGGLLDDNIF